MLNYRNDCFVITKTGKQYVCDLSIGTEILCVDNQHSAVKNIIKSNTKVLSVKGFWFNSFHVSKMQKLYVKKRENINQQTAQWLSAIELLENGNWQDYYIGVFGFFYDGVLDDAVYDGIYAWIPFKIVDENKTETVCKIQTENDCGIVLNYCMIQG